LYSGLLFAFSYSITYTCARTLSNKYKYDALQTGLVLFSFGIGVFTINPPRHLHQLMLAFTRGLIRIDIGWALV